MNTTVDGAPGKGPACPAAQRTGLEGRCREVILRRSQEMTPLLEDVVDAMAGRGYSARDRSGMRLALEEAVVNALRHGNGGDPAKRVRVCYHVGAGAVLAEVEDEGAGFDPSAVPDPTLPENLDRACGRGLLLMRHFMTAVRFAGRGNRVLLYKCRSA
jgi:serine/threonine-protein kinase RsbW